MHVQCIINVFLFFQCIFNVYSMYYQCIKDVFIVRFKYIDNTFLKHWIYIRNTCEIKIQVIYMYNSIIFSHPIAFWLEPLSFTLLWPRHILTAPLVRPPPQSRCGPPYPRCCPSTSAVVSKNVAGESSEDMAGHSEVVAEASPGARWKRGHNKVNRRGSNKNAIGCENMMVAAKMWHKRGWYKPPET